MTWQDEIYARLEGYSGYSVELGQNSISVICDNPDRFTVSLHVEKNEFLVGYDGWHEHFETLEWALDCFTFGLLGECRLKVTRRGATDCAWTLQRHDNGDWLDDTTVGLVLIPFWKRKTIVLRQNRLLKAP